MHSKIKLGDLILLLRPEYKVTVTDYCSILFDKGNISNLFYTDLLDRTVIKVEPNDNTLVIYIELLNNINKSFDSKI